MPFFQCSIVFIGHILSPEGISANPKKVEKVKNWPVPTNPKELQSFWGVIPTTAILYQNFVAITKCLHQLVGPANHQKTKKNKKINEPKADPKLDKQAFQWNRQTSRSI